MNGVEGFSRKFYEIKQKSLKILFNEWIQY